MGKWWRGKERNREKSGNGTKGKWETTACRPKEEKKKIREHENTQE